jgi:hypothetical protein
MKLTRKGIGEFGECRESRLFERKTKVNMKMKISIELNHIILIMSNRFAILGEAKEEEDEHTTGKNHKKHQLRAAKRAAERDAAKKLATQRAREREANRVDFILHHADLSSANDENIENRFVWHANPQCANQSIRLTPEMFPPLH